MFQAKQNAQKCASILARFSTTPILGIFYPQNLVSDYQKLGARVLREAYMINPKLYLFIYGFVFWRISGLKGKNN